MPGGGRQNYRFCIFVQTTHFIDTIDSNSAISDSRVGKGGPSALHGSRYPQDALVVPMLLVLIHYNNSSYIPGFSLNRDSRDPLVVHARDTGRWIFGGDTGFK